jgi:hypothetical protein
MMKEGRMTKERRDGGGKEGKRIAIISMGIQEWKFCLLDAKVV